MVIVDDHAAIAHELRRIRRERSGAETRPEPAPDQEAPNLDQRHPMRRTLAGDLLYRRLVMPRQRSRRA